ncbi:MAG TPA: caspase family protein [Pyrinomonadaceae bacterium]|jgi:hypothetical protein
MKKNRAIVIGIDKYEVKDWRLKGAVRDALEVRNWLLRPDGGNVREQEMFLLLSPLDTSSIPSGLTYYPADSSTIVEAIDRVVKESGGEAERFYFYFAGHGLTHRYANRYEEALAASDFTALHTDQSLEIDSILHFFRATQFKDQFFFIDGCRDIPWDEDKEPEFMTGRYPRPKRINFRLPPVQQFVMYATSLGLRAAEVPDADKRERGAFTSAVLNGLEGYGKAKVWDSGRQKYLVRWETLFEYVKDEVSKIKDLVIDARGNKHIQVPQQGGGQRGTPGRDSNPIITFIPDNKIKDETLEVYVDPSVIASSAEVSVRRDDKEFGKETRITNLPVSFTLKPREYSVYASAPEHLPKEELWPVPLYYSQDLTVNLIRKSPAEPSEDSSEMISASSDVR